MFNFGVIDLSVVIENKYTIWVVAKVSLKDKLGRSILGYVINERGSELGAVLDGNDEDINQR